MVCFLIAFITVQQVCALAALTVRKHKREGKNPIGAADLEWIFACNYEGTEVTNHLNSDLSDIFILPLLSFSTIPSSTSHSQKIPRDPHPGPQ